MTKVPAKAYILSVNGGSSSVKFALYQAGGIYGGSWLWTVIGGLVVILLIVVIIRILKK